MLLNVHMYMYLNKGLSAIGNIEIVLEVVANVHYSDTCSNLHQLLQGSVSDRMWFALCPAERGREKREQIDLMYG